MGPTHKKGNASEARVLSVFMLLGWEVLTPMGDGLRYDAVINRGSGFERVQIKTAAMKEGFITFKTTSLVTSRTGGTTGTRTYHGDADLFAAYCRELDSVYLIPVDEAPSNLCTLRTGVTLNGQVKRTRMASDYLLKF